MRLIDADKLPYEDIESIDGNTYMCVNAYDIEHAPTIEQSDDCISREEAKKLIQGKIDDIPQNKDGTYGSMFGQYVNGLYCAKTAISYMPSVQPQPKSEDMGEVSDGYHTFNQLYHQRAILFATIVNQNKDRAWKSYKHEDGKYCFDKDGEWFIVGIDTPLGSYTYHYSKEYWDYFDCEELECGKPWDGHTKEDVTRLLSLPSVTPQPKKGKWISIDATHSKCEKCEAIFEITSPNAEVNFCPSCGVLLESKTQI